MKNFMKYLNVGAFTILLIGGLNYLLMGLFNFNMFGGWLGNGVVSRIFYAVFGLAALLLIATVIARTILNDRKDNKQK